MNNWEWIPGYEGIYKISQEGKIKSFHIKEHSHNRSDGFMKYRYYTDLSGYKRAKVFLRKNKVRKQYFVYRLLALTYIPNPLNLPCINHKDCDPTNNNLNNLEWVTYKQNSEHSVKHGLRKSQKGRRFNTKLKDSDVIEVKKLIAQGIRVIEIANKYGLRTATIYNIKNKKSWNY